MKPPAAVPLLEPPFTEELLAGLLALNNSHADELSFKSPQSFRSLLAAASHVRAEASGLALIVAFNEGSTYDNPNFAWFGQRFRHFSYIDRVVVSGEARGRGLARLLYAGLEAETIAAGRQRLVCEINSRPPNFQSEKFHMALGFRRIGEQGLEGGKVVGYWVREVR